MPVFGCLLSFDVGMKRKRNSPIFICRSSGSLEMTRGLKCGFVCNQVSF
jgi:hypothetical protein